jgi:hypothetical protein
MAVLLPHNAARQTIQIIALLGALAFIFCPVPRHPLRPRGGGRSVCVCVCVCVCVYVSLHLYPHGLCSRPCMVSYQLP